MIIYTSVSEIDPSQWNGLVEKSTTATFFQTRACYDFYSSLSFLKPFVFGVSENNTLVGILCGYTIADGNVLKRFFSRRAIVPGGVLLAPDASEQAVKLLLDKAKSQLTRKAIYLELRNYNDYTAFRPAIESAGFEYRPHLNFHVATPDVETVTKNLSSSKKRQIKQSIKGGAEVVVATTLTEVHDYYRILKTLYVERVKSPLFPVEFFEKLIKLSNANILLIKVRQRVVGGITCVCLDTRTVSEWFVCGDDGGVDKGIYPSVLATWAGIEYALNNGYAKFDFMGAGKPDEGYGVREFKSKFGGELVEHGRFLYVCQPHLYTLGKYIVKKMKGK